MADIKTKLNVGDTVVYGVSLQCVQGGLKMAELKPCPFCGYKGVEILADDNKYLYYRYFSQCQRCGAGAKRGHTKEDAVKEWNRRANNG